MKPTLGPSSPPSALTPESRGTSAFVQPAFSRTQSAFKRSFGELAETDLEMQPTPSSRAEVSARAAAYRRLALTILGLDVPTLAADLRAQRRGPVRPTALIASRHAPVRARSAPTSVVSAREHSVITPNA